MSRVKKIPTRWKIVGLLIPIILGAAVIAAGTGIFQGNLAHVSGEVEKPQAKVTKDISIDLGSLYCGENFNVEKTYANALEIQNVSRVKLFFNLTGLEEEREAHAFTNGSVNIVIGDRHSNGTWDEYINVTLNLLNPIQQKEVLEVNGTHVYDVRIIIQGTTGYPTDGCAIDFNITISVVPP